jgi:GTP-binding protein
MHAQLSARFVLRPTSHTLRRCRRAVTTAPWWGQTRFTPHSRRDTASRSSLVPAVLLLLPSNSHRGNTAPWCCASAFPYATKSDTTVAAAFSSDAKRIDADDGSLPDLCEFKEYLRDKASKGAFRKVFNTMSECEQGVGPYGHLDPDADVYRVAVRCLLRASRANLAHDLYKLRVNARERRPQSLRSDVGLVASIIRAVIREGKTRKGDSCAVSFLCQELQNGCVVDPVLIVGDATETSAANKTSSLLSVASALIDNDKTKESAVKDAVRIVYIVKDLAFAAGTAAAAPVSDYNNVIRLLGKRRRVGSVFAIVDAMRASNVELNDETFEFLANAAVRQVDFVTGAVSMDTLPEPLIAEVAFVGRSNVGKSSLVNMICNRKALAYVSGRPGKTQQFNYFVVNSREKQSAFYLVDLPGVGYAKVPRAVQDEWLMFMDQYLASRPTLEVVFHLVDGRHGAIGEDELLMERIANSTFAGQYVVVLTKMDKMDKQKVAQSRLDKIRALLARKGCSPDTPIIVTSASTKLGRDEMWRYLQRAIRFS